jgi:hypothetical protein
MRTRELVFVHGDRAYVSVILYHVFGHMHGSERVQLDGTHAMLAGNTVAKYVHMFLYYMELHVIGCLVLTCVRYQLLASR